MGGDSWDRTDTLYLTELDDMADRQGGARAEFRIGLLLPMCGAAGLWAPSCISCAQVALRELNRGDGIAGRPVRLILIDAAEETAQPVEAVINELIDTGAIDAIVGMHLSATRQRLSKIIRQRIPYVYTPLYEGGETTPGIYAIGDTPDRHLGPALTALQRMYRPRGWALIGNDYVWPRPFNAFAKTRLREMSVPVVHEEYHGFGTSGIDQAVERVAASGAEGVLVSLIGQDAVNFNRAFGRAGLQDQMIRLSCACEENALLACGARNNRRMFSASSYFGNIPTEANAAFRESYYTLHGDSAPVLNTLGQSTYEGVHFLAGLMQRGAPDWRGGSFDSASSMGRRSVRRGAGLGHAPVYLSRADGLQFEVIETF